MMRKTALLIFATGLAASGAAADPLLAAPGDCAQPSRDLVTEPVYQLPAGVAGPVSNHFAPVDVVDDVRGLLPVDLTRVSVDTRVGVVLEPGSLVENAVQTLTSNPILEPVTSNPILEPVTSNPILEPVTSNPILEPVTSNPILEPLTSNPILEPLNPTLQAVPAVNVNVPGHLP